MGFEFLRSDFFDFYLLHTDTKGDITVKIIIKEYPEFLLCT